MGPLLCLAKLESRARQSFTLYYKQSKAIKST